MKFSIASLGEEPAPRYADLVRLCELLGYDGLCHTDTKWTRDVFVRLSQAAISTSRIGLNMTTADPYTRHPALTAQATASVGELSNGRLKVVLGIGSHYETMPGYGPTKPVAGLREAAEVMRRLWAGERVTVEGREIRFLGGKFDFTVAPRHVPKLWLAGRGPKVLELAGEIGDGALVGSYAIPAGIEWARSHIARGLTRAGRSEASFPIASWLYVCLLEREGDPIPEAIRRGISHGIWSSRDVIPDVLPQLGVELPDDLVDFLRNGPRSWAGEVLTEVRRLIPDSVAAAMAVVGTPSQVADRLATLHDAGVTEFMIWPTPRPGQGLEEFVIQLADDVVTPLRGPISRDTYEMID